MDKNRLEAFSDGVIAIIITIMVLELQGRLAGDWQGKVSARLYLTAIPLAFLNVWIANGIYIFVALMWLVPDRRIKRVLEKRKD